MKKEISLVIKIRTLQNKDVQPIVNIIRTTLSSLDAQKAREDFQDSSYVDRGNYVAVVEGKIVGTIGYWRLGHDPQQVAWLDWFVVHQKYQRRGIGSSLLQSLVQRLKQKKFKMLCVEKSSNDTSADRFYQRHQFIERGRIKKYWEDGGDFQLMVKTI